MIERVKENKSLVDIRLTTGTCREFFQNDTDSCILASSDSDYWGSDLSHAGGALSGPGGVGQMRA